MFSFFRLVPRKTSVVENPFSNYLKTVGSRPRSLFYSSSATELHGVRVTCLGGPSIYFKKNSSFRCKYYTSMSVPSFARGPHVGCHAPPSRCRSRFNDFFRRSRPCTTTNRAGFPYFRLWRPRVDGVVQYDSRRVRRTKRTSTDRRVGTVA